MSVITLLQLFWRGFEARARGRIYLHLLEPAKLSVKIDALDRLRNPNLYFQSLFQSNFETMITSDSKRVCKRTWYFTFNLQASMASDDGVAPQLQSIAFSHFRKNSMKTASIISFSSSADGSPRSPESRGFIKLHSRRVNQ